MTIDLDRLGVPGWLEHYQPLLDFCLSKGCVLKPPFTWKRPHLGSRGGGDEVDLYGPVTVDMIKEAVGLTGRIDVSAPREDKSSHFFDWDHGVHFRFHLCSAIQAQVLLVEWDEEKQQRKAELDKTGQVIDALHERMDTKPTEH